MIANLRVVPPAASHAAKEIVANFPDGVSGSAWAYMVGATKS
jgi:hypothetical protein